MIAMKMPIVSTLMAHTNVNVDEVILEMGGNVKRLVSKLVTKVDVQMTRIINAYAILVGRAMIVPSIVVAITIQLVEWELENVMSVKITQKENSAKDASLEAMEMQQTQQVVFRAIVMVTVIQWRDIVIKQMANVFVKRIQLLKEIIVKIVSKIIMEIRGIVENAFWNVKDDQCSVLLTPKVLVHLRAAMTRVNVFGCWN
jgi:hypothetical protein